MTQYRTLLLGLSLVTILGACASNPPRPMRSDFEDIPVPKGLVYRAEESTVIESPGIKAGRHVYRGRIEPESLATAIRTTLESNGWRHVSSTSTAKLGSLQVFEKAGDSLQVQIWEGMWYTYAEYTTGRVLQRTRQ